MNDQSIAQLKCVATRLFESLDKKNFGFLTEEEIKAPFYNLGIGHKNQRVKRLFKKIEAISDKKKISSSEFAQAIKEDVVFVEKILQGNMVIPDFTSFCREVTDIFEKIKLNKAGKVADYIPQLSRVDPEKYALSICTIDGQQFQIGDVKDNFCVQSSSKPFSYCMALDEFGSEEVHNHVGREPSGKSFNELTLNEKGLPHNPMINSGAIMTCSMIKPSLNIADRFDYVLETWKKMSGGSYIGFNNSVYLSERQTADRNFALGYFMRENSAFPEKTNLLETLEFYFQCCSIELNTRAMSNIAATLANGGTSPLTGEEVFSPATVKNCLSLMGSCGMYDFSGEFSFKIGLPAKSGVSGVVILVIPNVMGICIWSPRLDALGNSVRGLDFCQELVSRYNFHMYDSLVSHNLQKKDPRQHKNQALNQSITDICWAASRGDLETLQRMLAMGFETSLADYDGRTPLHLAASEGHLEVIKYLKNHGADFSMKDRWGATPLDDAKKGKHKEVRDYIEKEMALVEKSMMAKKKGSSRVARVN